MRAVLNKIAKAFPIGIISLLVIFPLNGCSRFAKTEPGGTGESTPWYSPGRKTQAQPQPQPQPEISYYIHTVKWQGESVSIIAAWYTGTIDNWKELATANPDINPDRIFVGNKIRIPENLMTTHSPMPEEFIYNFVPKTKKHIPAKQAPAKKTEEPELFGPK